MDRQVAHNEAQLEAQQVPNDAEAEEEMGQDMDIDGNRIELLSPNEAHLQIGMVHTHFQPIKSDDFKQFSEQGMKI